MMKTTANVGSTFTTKDILSLAAIFGLLTGLVEGAALFALRQAGWLNWRLANRSIWYETLWVAPLFDLALFLLAGFAIVLTSRVVRVKWFDRMVWTVFLFLCLLDFVLILLFGRLSLAALAILVLGIGIQLSGLVASRQAILIRWIPSLLKSLAGLTVAVFILVQGGAWMNEWRQASALPEAEPGAPNVIVIVADTLRADHLSSYGYERETSPFIDKLAEEGARFETAVSPSSWTQPSHASMLTGLYTSQHQAETQPLDGRYPTIGEVLQASGYRTGAFSANTLFFTRRQGFGRGFQHFEDSYQAPADFFLHTMYGFMFDHYVLRKTLNYEGTPGRRSAVDINASALDWLDKDPDRPSFIFINYFDVHDPYLPPEPYRSRFASVENPGGLINGYVERYNPELTPEQLQSEIDAYDGAISYLDDRVGDLFAELEQRKMLNRTIVILTSDHGESLGEHGLLQHSGSLYIQEIHIPLIVWAPGRVPAGVTVETPVSTTALPSTILSLIGLPHDTFAAPSLTTLIFDQPSGEWDAPLSEVAQFEGAAEQNPSTHGEIKSVLTLDWHLIEHETFGTELYNWQTDMQETRNLAAEEENLSLIDALKKYLFERVAWFENQ